MFFKKEKENKQEQPKKLYNATYKSLHSGKEIVLKTSTPTQMLNSFLKKDEEEDEYDVYILTYITPLDEVTT